MKSHTREKQEVSNDNFAPLKFKLSFLTEMSLLLFFKINKGKRGRERGREWWIETQRARETDRHRMWMREMSTIQ